MKKIGHALIIIAVILASANTITSIGYGIYEWANYLPFPQALWEAFKLWLEVALAAIGIGAVGLVFRLW